MSPAVRSVLRVGRRAGLFAVGAWLLAVFLTQCGAP